MKNEKKNIAFYKTSSSNFFPSNVRGYLAVAVAAMSLCRKQCKQCKQRIYPCKLTIFNLVAISDILPTEILFL